MNSQQLDPWPLRLFRWDLAIVLCAGFFIVSVPLAAAGSAERAFDIPAGNAEQTLRLFSRQAGAQFVFSADKVKGVRTNPLKGRYTCPDALNRLIAGTDLSVVRDERTEALTVRYIRPPASPSESTSPQNDPMNTRRSFVDRYLTPLIAVLATSAPALAQNGSSAQTPESEVVRLSPFEVVTTQGHGYVAGNAVSGLKTNESLLNIPQIDTVITRDFIDDVGFAASTAVTQYFGAGNTYFPSENTYIRGARINYPYVDEMPQNASYEDNVWVDSYELIKGPAQVLYLNAYLSGAELKTSKVPLPFRRETVMASINSQGTYNAVFDATGPIGELAGMKLGYRVVGHYKSGSYYYVNYKDDLETIFPEISVQWKNTFFRVYYTLEKHFGPVNEGQGFLTPGGDLFTGQGRKYASNGTLGNTMKYENNRFYGEMITDISQNASNRLKVGMSRNRRGLLGSETYPTSLDWNAQLCTWEVKSDQFDNGHWSILDDFQAKYDLGVTHNSDIVGFGYDDYVSKQKQWTAVNWGFVRPVVNIYNGPALAAIQFPGWQDYDAHIASFPNQGTHGETVTTSIYWSHSIDITKYFSLTGGWSWSGVTTYSVANISSLPWTPVEVPLQQYLHRYGAIFKPIAGVSLYAFDATSFVPNGVGTTYTYTNVLPPPNVGKGREIGFKTALFGGRLSTDFAWFHLATTNIYAYAGATNPQGNFYVIPVGDVVQEGVDGDVAFSVVPGWQVIGSFYAGHDRDRFQMPVAGTYDNSWSLLNRYDFQPDSSLHGFQFGVGVIRFGGRWASTAGYVDAPFSAYTSYTGELKAKTGTEAMIFVGYKLKKHWSFKVMCNNVLDEIYAAGVIQASMAIPAQPRTFTFEMDYRFE